MSKDKVPTFDEIGEVCNLTSEQIDWALTQLSIGSQTAGVVTRQNPTPVALFAGKDLIKAVTLAGSYLVFVEVSKATQQVIYIPLAGAVFAVADGSEGVTLSAKVGAEGVSISGKDKDALGVNLSRIHQYVRATVIDYRRN